jgi:SAM-dependent methyltransferase
LSDTSFNQEDIRPAKLRAQLDEILQRDVKLWLESRDRWVEVPCPSCLEEWNLKAFRIRDFPFAECRECGTVFHNPRPTADQLENYYHRAESYTFWAEKIFPASRDHRKTFIARPMANLLDHWTGQAGSGKERLLEVGSGAGLFLEEMRDLKTFPHLEGIEPTPALAEVLRTNNFTVHEKTFEACEFPTAYTDALCAFEVIEHLFEPREFLLTAHRILRPRGVLMLSCPNVRGFDFEVLGLENAGNIGLEHINMFHPESLKNLLEDCGFQVLTWHTPGHLDADLVRTSILDGKLDVTDRPFLKRVLIDDWDKLAAPFQDFLRDNGLSSNMVMIAARR